jgi:hypothetical protein
VRSPLTPPRVPHPVALIGQHAPPAEGYRIAYFESLLADMADRLARLRAARDRRAVFQLTYLTFSQHVLAAVRAGRFSDPAWAIDMCCRFVEVYLEQLARWDRRDPSQCGAWRRAFGEIETGRANVMQAMLLGMNAHINYDLAFVTLGSCRQFGDLADGEAGVAALRGTQSGVPTVRYADFLLINQVAWHSLPAIQDTVLRSFHPVFYAGNVVVRPLTAAMGQRVLLDARESAWMQTSLLLHARTDTERSAVAALIDASATAVAERIALLSLDPRRIRDGWRAWRTRGRLVDATDAETVLTMAAADPVVADLALTQLARLGASPAATLDRWAVLGDDLTAATFGAAVYRDGPAPARSGLAAYLRRQTPASDRVLTAMLEREALPPARRRGLPVAALASRSSEAEAFARAAAEDASVQPHPRLRSALLRAADALLAQRRRLTDPQARPAPAARHLPPDALADALRAHDDRWVALCAQAAFPTPSDLASPMSTTIERVLFLKETQAFMEVDLGVLVSVAERLVVERYAPGAVLLREGEPSPGIRFIVSGTVAVSQARDAGPVEIATLGPHDTIGEISTLNATDATADCTARTAVECLVLPREVLTALLHQHPRLAVGLLRTLSDRLIATTHQVRRRRPTIAT